MAEIKVTGLSELQKLLDELPATIEKNIVRGALRAGANVIKEEAKRLCPEAAPSSVAKKYGAQRGELKRSIRVSLRYKEGRVTASIKAGNAKAFYAVMVEKGTASHLIKAKPGSSLFFAGSNINQVMHGGAEKKRFMRPALDGKAGTAVDTVAQYIRDRIPKELGKLK